jgi:signal transduction histidine kinase
MTPLTRLLTFTLVLLLALLVAASATRGFVKQRAQVAARTGQTVEESASAHALLDRGSMALSLSALGVAVLLIFILGFTSKSRADTQAPFSSRERERRSLSLLASTSARTQEALNFERDEREKAQADAQERLQLLNQALEEKIRLGRDLHDGVIQSLYAAGLTLESGEQLLAQDPAKAHESFAKSRDLINRGIADIRSYIGGLSPRSVRRDSLKSGLAEAVELLRAGRPLDVDWKIEAKAVAQLSDAQISETLQITREAVSNALRHGGAQRLFIALQPDDHGAVLTLRDDGTGFTPASTSPTGHGLNNMAARAESALGSFQITSAPGAGSCIQINWQTSHSS